MEENDLVETENLQPETPPESISPGQTTDAITHVELDPKSKYKYGDLEFTADDLKQGYMRQSDYTKKTQEISEFRKDYRYRQALDADLDTLEKFKSDPEQLKALVNEFKQLYPKNYHKYLRYYSQTQTGQAPSQSIPPEIEQKIAKYDQYFEQMEQEKTQKEVDAAFDKYTKKYPLAYEAAVVATAQNFWATKRQKALAAGEDLTSLKMTDQEWENVFKSVHQEIEKLSTGYQKNKFERQREASHRLKDVPSGGGVPGQKPNMPKTIKEAKEIMMRDLLEA